VFFFFFFLKNFYFPITKEIPDSLNISSKI